MILASCRKRGVTVAASVLLVTTVAAGCSSSDDKPEVARATPSATATTDTAAADEAAVVATVDKFWAASIKAQNGPDSDPELFTGIATGPDVELILKTAKNYDDQGIRRTGAPTLGEPTISVTGETATAELCVDESSWGAERKGVQIPPPPDAKASPRHLLLERQAGSWLVTGIDDDAADTLTC